MSSVLPEISCKSLKIFCLAGISQNFENVSASLNS